MRLLKKSIALITIITTIFTCICSVKADFTQFPPQGSGTMHTYTVWNWMRWSGDSKQLIDYGYNNNLISDTYGIIKYGDFLAGATTTNFGQVGDILLVVETDGYVYPVIIQDIKSQYDDGCNIWGHHYGRDIVEFEILSCMRGILYNGSGSYINEYMNRPIYKVINIGNIYNDNYYFYNLHEACIDYGLSGYTLLDTPYGGNVI